MSTLTASVAALTARDHTDTRRPRPWLRMVIALGVLVAAIAAYLFWDLTGRIDYVLPRRAWVVASLAVVAVAMSVSTVLFQTVTANRILTPSIMGYDSMFALVQTVLMVALGAGGVAAMSSYASFGLEVGLMMVASLALFNWLFVAQKRSLHLLVLVGIVLGIFFRSITGFLQRLMDPSDFVIVQDRLFARFTAVDRELVVLSVVVLGAACAGAWLLRHQLDVLALGRDQAVSLGVDHRRVVMTVLVLVTVMVSVSTALVGPVGFFGLLVAALSYELAGSQRHRWTLPFSAVLGAAVLIGGQAVLEHGFGLNTTLSVIVEFVGGIVFLLILIKGARR